jgi:hypothetical protein
VSADKETDRIFLLLGRSAGGRFREQDSRPLLDMLGNILAMLGDSPSMSITN